MLFVGLQFVEQKKFGIKRPELQAQLNELPVITASHVYFLICKVEMASTSEWARDQNQMVHKTVLGELKHYIDVRHVWISY